MALKEINLLTTDNVKNVSDTVEPRDNDVASAKSVRTQLGSISAEASVGALHAVKTGTGTVSDTNPHGLTAADIGTYDSTTIDDKITKTSAHYVTSTPDGDAFSTPDALKSAEKFYYAGAEHDIDNNDYAIVLDDGGKTARWGYYVSAEAGSSQWQRQYYINETAFTNDQWAAIDSGIKKDLVPQILTIDESAATKKIVLDGKVFTSFDELTALVQKGVTRLKYYVTNASSRPVLYTAHLCDDSAIRFDVTGTLDATVYTRSIAITKSGDDGIYVSVYTLTDMAKKDDIPDVVEPSASVTPGQAADAKAVGDALKKTVLLSADEEDGVWDLNSMLPDAGAEEILFGTEA